MDAMEVPKYFLCPISLQLMKDPVTTITGITYDRPSIEEWLFAGGRSSCPVSNQPLPAGSPLTPNLTLRRLIQSWSASAGATDRITTPRAPADRLSISRLLYNCSISHLRADALSTLESLASDSESNCQLMKQSGVPTRIASFMIESIEDREQALRILSILRPNFRDFDMAIVDGHDLVDALGSIMTDASSSLDAKSRAITLLKIMFQDSNSVVMERLSLQFFVAVVKLMRPGISRKATKAAATVLLSTCPWAGNRARMIDAGAVTELIEVELGGPADRRRTELVLGVLDNLCASADGRAQLMGHAAGIAMVSKRILRVSVAVDERAVGVLSAVCRCTGTTGVEREMLAVGAVAKLCMVLQSECALHVKEAARRTLRLHAGAWSGSPCVQLYLLTRFPEQQ